MLRWLFLLLLSPFWLPYRLFRRLTVGRRKAQILNLDLRGSLPDVSEGSGLAGLWGRRASGPDLLTILHVLDAAVQDPKLEQVVVYLEDVHCGLARAEELRAALGRVREAGKQVIVFAESFELSQYWAALGASTLCITPTGTLHVLGFSMEFTLLKGVLDKAGIQAQLRGRGKYKSMAEMFTAEQISPANQEMLESLTHDLYTHFQDAVQHARKLTPQQLDVALAQAPLRAEQALQAGLVDRLVYADELRSERKDLGLRGVSLAQYQKKLNARRVLPRRRPKVALLRVAGNIISGAHQQGPNGRRATGSSAFSKALRKVVDASDIGAVVLRVDSPGGSALASDVMWRELGCAVRSLSEKGKPVMVSMANVAASGGYYVSGLSGVPVWALPTTLTGSIGVVAGKFEVSRMLDKIGLHRALVVSGPRAAYASPTRPWTEAELGKLSEDLDAAYHDFVQKMASARGVSYEQLDAVAQGRVWTGAQAKAHGLVDHLGGLHEVSLWLGSALKCPPSEMQWINAEERSSLSQLRRRGDTNPLVAALSSELGLSELCDAWRAAAALGSERVLLLLPFKPPT